MNHTNHTKRSEILQTIRTALSPWLKDSELIQEGTDLITEIGIDSVGILQMILHLENEYQIIIPEYELDVEMLSSVKGFIDLIESKTNANM